MPNLLCIDDYRAGLAIRRTLLESRGCSVLTAEDGVTGLKLLAQRTVDAVVLDYRMEGMDGEAVARAIKLRYPAVPIILLTGFPRDIPERLLRLVDAYVAKGEPAAKLLEAIEKVTRVELKRTKADRLPESAGQIEGKIPEAKPVASADEASLQKRQRTG